MIIRYIKRIYKIKNKKLVFGLNYSNNYYYLIFFLNIRIIYLKKIKINYYKKNQKKKI